MEEIVFLILVGYASVTGQRPEINLEPVPDKCTRPAEFMYRQCCIFPPFFTRQVAKACGAVFKLLSIDRENNITAIRREPTTLCEHWKCVLQKYELLNADDTLDDDKYYAHLDKWSSLNQDFASVLTDAKKHCKNTYRMFLPLRVCEFFDIHGCIRNFINVQCPAVFPTKECAEVKKFYDECREFYL